MSSTKTNNLRGAGFYLRPDDAHEVAEAVYVLWTHMCRLDSGNLRKWQDATVPELVNAVIRNDEGLRRLYSQMDQRIAEAAWAIWRDIASDAINETGCDLIGRENVIEIVLDRLDGGLLDDAKEHWRSMSNKEQRSLMLEVFTSGVYGR